MKGLNLLEKIIFSLNVIVAVLLLLSYTLSFLPPQRFGVLAVLSLGVPVLIIFNILFALYWFLKFKKQVVPSIVVLLLGFNYLTAMYQFSNEKTEVNANSFTVMSYNVRLFNLFNWIDEQQLEGKIKTFISSESPDVLSIQEYHIDEAFQLEGYYKYESVSGNQVKNGRAIFSKFPIINSGSIQFPNTSNDAIFVDVVKLNDTLRVYNLHLQSSKINTSMEALKEEGSENLFNRMSKTFKIQQSQAELLLKHIENSPYQNIITGDFNNTPYSYVYNEIKGDFKDAYDEAGEGFGSTYDFKFFPFRIDFILTDAQVMVNEFRTYSDVKYSDHYPIKATLSLH